MINLFDFPFFGFPSNFTGFAQFVLWLLGSAFDIIFIVIVLNVAMSILRAVVLYLAGVKK